MGIIVEGEIRVDRIDRYGNIQNKIISKKFDSFVYNFMKWFCNSFIGSATFPVIDTGGVSRSIDYDGVLNCIAAPSTSTYGIRVGTDSTPTVAGDYNLHGIINDGFTDGLIAYAGMGNATVNTVGSDIQLKMIRTFVNFGATTLTLRELDLVTNTGTYMVELLRDTFSDIIIPQFEGVNVNIIITITV